MRKTFTVAALMLALCCSTFAGEIPTPPVPQPPSQDGIMHGDNTNSLIQTALAVIVSVLP
jgi:hypothetical protein